MSNNLSICQCIRSEMTILCFHLDGLDFQDGAVNMP